MYKSTLRRSRFEYNCNQTYKLKMLKHKNAKDYWNWKLLKGAFSDTKSNAKMKDFVIFFQAVNNPDDPFFTPDEDVTDLFDRYIQGEVQVMFDEMNVSISYDEINTAIGQLSNGKSGGPDKILNDFYFSWQRTLATNTTHLI